MTLSSAAIKGAVVLGVIAWAAGPAAADNVATQAGTAVGHGTQALIEFVKSGGGVLQDGAAENPTTGGVPASAR